MLFVWSRKTAGVVQLCCGRACGLWTSVAARRHGIPIVSGLHAAYMNSEAILQAAGLKERDLLYVRFEGQQRNVLPYYLAVDHSTRSVIMAIRGSLSLDDCVRDLLFEPADLDEWIDGADVAWNAALPPVRPATPSSRFAAHSGIFEAARATLEDARVHGGLADIMSGQKHVARSNVHRNGDHDNDAVGSSSHEGYRLVVCGHSLGAGCAFLISLYLRRFFPTLRCFAFSPPGGLATADLCAASMEWCTSTVCGRLFSGVSFASVIRVCFSCFHRDSACLASVHTHRALVCSCLPILPSLAGLVIFTVSFNALINSQHLTFLLL
jgi:sn1-specific diacylglycerol lipase